MAPTRQSRIDAFLDMELSIKNAMRPWIGTTRGWLSASDEEVKNVRRVGASIGSGFVVGILLKEGGGQRRGRKGV